MKVNKKTQFRCSLNFQTIIRRSPQASPTKNWKIEPAVNENYEIQSAVRVILGATKKTGGGRFSAPPSLFFERPKIVQTGA